MERARNSCGRPNRSAGITLVELMVVLTIVSTLAMVAYPSFMQNVRKSKRTDAHTALTKATTQQERFFATNGTYTTDASKLGFEGGESAHSSDGYYSLTITPGSTGIGSSYVITAKAAEGSMQAKDTECVSMSINSFGERTPDPASSTCW